MKPLKVLDREIARWNSLINIALAIGILIFATAVIIGCWILEGWWQATILIIAVVVGFILSILTYVIKQRIGTASDVVRSGIHLVRYAIVLVRNHMKMVQNAKARRRKAFSDARRISESPEGK